ncbi:putative FAD dependent oxidoreductase, partial [Aureobasidium pullulans]
MASLIRQRSIIRTINNSLLQHRQFSNTTCTNADFTHAVIGGGAVGLAIARRLQQHNPSSTTTSTVLIEQHKAVGTETSSRNSEVIHAGIYYGHDSLKTKLCVQGKNMLYELCDKHSIPYKNCGKWVVAQDEAQAEAVEKVHAFAKSIGVPTNFLSRDEAARREPDVRAGREQHNAETDLQTAHHADVVLQESVFEQSTTAHTDLHDLGEEGSREYTDASQEAESVIEPEESLDVNLEDKESHIEAPAAETSQFHDIAAPEVPLEAFSSKKSKKDRKKAKKSKQRGFEAEPVQDEATEATSSTAPEEMSERSIDVENQEPITSGFDDTPAPPQMPEAEPYVAQSSVVQATLTEVAQSSPADAAIILETHHNDANIAEPDAIGHMEGLETSCDAKKPGSVEEVLSEDKSEEHTAGTRKLTTESPKPEQAERLSIDEEFGTVDVVEPHKDAQEDIASSIAFGSEHTNLGSSVIGEPVDAQVDHPEPAVVEDQAPSVLDQLIMAETISDHNSTEPSEEVETPRNMDDTVPQDEPPAP